MRPFHFLSCLLILFPLLISGQSRWSWTYHDDWDSQLKDFKVCYDDGYFICGRKIGALNASWLLKTNINGEPLWEKIFIETNGYLSLSAVSMNQQGEIFLAGSTQGVSSYYDAIVIKLDACGEKAWCRKISTESDHDYARDICGLDDGGCTISLKYSGGIPGDDRICLLNLDHAGNFIWKECYDGLDTNMIQPDHEDLLLTPDGGYLISGSTLYRNNIPPYYNRRKPLLIKTDPLGHAEWLHFIEKDSSSRGESFNTVISPNGQFYCTSLKYYPEIYWPCPAFALTGPDGDLIRLVALDTAAHYGQLSEVQFLNDSLLAGVGISGEDWADRKAIVFDTSGNILHQVSYLYESFLEIIKTAADEKILVCTQKHDYLNNYHTYLFKFNNQLIDDTLYLQPQEYDYHCPYSITNDTIHLDDCDLILEVTEDPIGNYSPVQPIKAYPNPCSTRLNVSLPEGHEYDQITLYSSIGQQIYEQHIGTGTKRVTIDLESFPPGMIIARATGARLKAQLFKVIKM